MAFGYMMLWISILFFSNNTCYLVEIMKVLGGLVLYYSFMAQVLMASQSSSASDVNGDKRENFLNSLFNHFNLRVPESHQKDML